MTNKILLFILAIATAGCGQEGSKNSQNPSASGPGQTEAATPGNPTLDSIDMANDESVINAGDDLTKAYVAEDSTISLTANMRADHRIIGYAQPDTASKRLLMLSVFTNDVENNPFNCELGAYYDTAGMENLTLKYQGTIGDFARVIAIDKSNKATTLFILKKWLVFE